MVKLKKAVLQVFVDETQVFSPFNCVNFGHLDGSDRLNENQPVGGQSGPHSIHRSLLKKLTCLQMLMGRKFR